MILKNTYFYLMPFIFLAGCDTKDKNFDDMSAKDLYTLADTNLKAKKYKDAAKYYSELERQHPYSDLAINAQLMGGYSYYLEKKYDEAQEMFESFTKLHPQNKNVDYALYMIGIIEYEQIPIVQRDQEPAKYTLEAFERLINRFPNSVYALDAKLKIDFLKDHLAAKELEIAYYYQKKFAYVSAINRLKNVIDYYQNSSHVPEALYRMYVCYKALGIDEEAQRTASVLGHNYQDSQWYKKVYALEKE